MQLLCGQPAVLGRADEDDQDDDGVHFGNNAMQPRCDGNFPMAFLYEDPTMPPCEQAERTPSGGAD